MTDEDPFPDAPTYDELEEMAPEMDEYDDLTEFANDAKPWYNKAPFVAARLIVQAARDHDEFRDHMIQNDEFGAAFAMEEWDEERHEKLNSMGLSAFQGGSAENLARSTLRDE